LARSGGRLRIIGGSAGGLRLKPAPEGVRPTSDLVRGAIFDVVEAHNVDMSRVLDLYAGSGAMGIEALSRGAAWCDFVDRAQACVDVIRANLAIAHVEDHAKVWKLTAERAIERLEGPYSLVFADPPYNDDAAPRTIKKLGGTALLGSGTTLVVEHSVRRDPVETIGPLYRVWSRRYGDTHVTMYRAV
jgi:16S rRNA (guanine966-N2)-methyltransferase